MNRAERRRQKKLAKKAARNGKLGKATIGSPGQKTPGIQQSIALAMQHHNAGDLLKAEDIYRQILQVDPNQPVALHLLGLAAHQAGKNETAVELITKALVINPDYAEAHSNLGLALQNLGQLDEAVASYQEALAIEPDFAEAYNNLGNALHKQKKPEEAVESYNKALVIRPDYVAAHNNLGNVLKKLGKLDEAVETYHNALAIKPDYAEAHSNLGNTLKILGRLDEALASYRRALDIDPGRHDLRHLISSISGETTDMAPEKYIRELFDEYADRFDDHLTDTLGYEIPALMRQAVDALSGGPETFPRALDLGCGTGLVAENFQDMAGEIDGVDLSPKMLVQAEAKGVYANLYLADVLEFLEGPDVSPAGYDLIVSADTFIYIGKLDGIFAATRRALTDGGLFVFSVEHLEDGDFRLLTSGRYSQSDAYIEKLAAESGFAVVCHDPVTVRIEKKSPIPGRIFVLGAAG
ncbi:MAG: tetratricopeptide repeat protein [Alphaproteobacteria bacterium]|nr:tetratricopeptide repeat protein [Alphaproteobacteria bacterium]